MVITMTMASLSCQWWLGSEWWKLEDKTWNNVKLFITVYIDYSHRKSKKSHHLDRGCQAGVIFQVWEPSFQDFVSSNTVEVKSDCRGPRKLYQNQLEYLGHQCIIFLFLKWFEFATRVENHCPKLDPAHPSLTMGQVGVEMSVQIPKLESFSLEQSLQIGGPPTDWIRPADVFCLARMGLKTWTTCQHSLMWIYYTKIRISSFYRNRNI